MNIIDRYATEVSKRLPLKNRADIEKELRSTLEDMLEDRAQETGQPASEKMAMEILKEYGAPDKVAATYTSPQYLIGPRLYPFFWMVLRIVLAVLTGVTFIGFGIRYGMNPGGIQDFLAQLGSTFRDYVDGLMGALANIVIVFAILQRVLPASDFETSEKEWNPADLMQEPDKNEVRLWEPIFAMTWIIIGFVIFNFYPNLLGYSFRQGDMWIFVPSLTAAFWRMLPFVNVIWICQLVLQGLLLRQGRWNTGTRIFAFILQVFSVVIAAILLGGPSIVSFDSLVLAKSTVSVETLNTLTTIFQPMIRIALLVAVVVGSVDAFKMLRRLVISKRM